MSTHSSPRGCNTCRTFVSQLRMQHHNNAIHLPLATTISSTRSQQRLACRAPSGGCNTKDGAIHLHPLRRLQARGCNTPPAPFVSCRNRPAQLTVLFPPPHGQEHATSTFTASCPAEKQPHATLQQTEPRARCHQHQCELCEP